MFFVRDMDIEYCHHKNPHAHQIYFQAQKILFKQPPDRKHIYKIIITKRFFEHEKYFRQQLRSISKVFIVCGNKFLCKHLSSPLTKTHTVITAFNFPILRTFEQFHCVHVFLPYSKLHQNYQLPILCTV